MPEPKATHTGWFLFCPIYLADLESEGPVVWARHWAFEPLFWAAGVIQAASICVLSRVNPEYEPMWMFWAIADESDRG